jgi:tRNA pseudouridine13 synthase
MKIKQLPEDFQVDELTDLAPVPDGAFALYRLEKTGWTTPDALRVIQTRWKLDRRRISCGGLKDRHARTAQHLTIFRGPQRHLTHQRLKLTYLGQASEPFTSEHIRANRFRLTLRDLTARQLDGAGLALEEVRRQGVPNYFDDQRFSSVSPPASERQPRFVARALIAGDFEGALRLALTASYEHDRAPQKKEKTVLRSHWGDWATCRRQLPRGHVRGLVDHLLSQPHDFRGAMDRLRPELHGLYLSAYQSHLWNRMLARWLRDHVPPDKLVEVALRLADVPMHRDLDEARQAALAALTLPLPSARMQLEATDPRRPLVETVLAEDGLRIEEMKLKGLRTFFSRGERPALCIPAELISDVADDELHRGRQKLLLSFDLPRGAYATLLVKRISRGVSARGESLTSF